MRDIGNAPESRRKRARTEDSTLAAERSNEERATNLSRKLSTLLKEFPEMKFLIDFENLQESVAAAVEKYAINCNEKSVLLYSLPDEMLHKCLSFLGKGHYGSVGLVSKKLKESYEEEFGHETAYLEMATSVQLTDYCINELCQSWKEKDEMFKAAAVNGNLDILRYADLNGYDFFPLVEMEHNTSYTRDGDLYYEDEDHEIKFSSHKKVRTFKLVERDHLHVLKYLHEELHYCLGLQRYCKPAIQHGKLAIIQWLQSIGCMDHARLNTGLDFCGYAIKSGKLEVLKWLLSNEFGIKESNKYILADAIRSKSLEMIQYCYDLGHDDLQDVSVEDAIKETRSVEVFRLMYELGYQFTEIGKWCCGYRITDYFEIIKFLRSISVPWDNGFMLELVADGTLEMIQFAHEDGCPWDTQEFNVLFGSDKFSFAKFEYLIGNGCTFDYDMLYTYSLVEKKDFALLDYFVGKNTKFDNTLLQDMLKYCGYHPWFEGISYLLEKGKDVQNFKSIEDVFHFRNNIDGIKYFQSQGLPWCLDSSRNTHLLSRIACYNDLDDVKWAYENGCRGGYLVPYVAEEWEWGGIRQNRKWKENQTFFTENQMLAQTLFEEKKIISRINVVEIGDAQFKPKPGFIKIDLTTLKSLFDHGYTFRSLSEKESVTKEAFKECCRRSSSIEESRKRFAIIQQIGNREL